MYDFLIVGCGLYGATFANKCLKNNKKVLIIDQRDHIAGNCYTEDVKGIQVHKYGPHIFHTNNRTIWDFVNEFTEFNHYVNRPKVNYKGNIYSFPINLFTLYQLWGVKTPFEAERKLRSVRVPCDDPKNLEQWILSQVGEEIYQTFIKGYTTKQWRKDPKELPSAIIRRLPIRLTFDDNYFNDRFQGIPVDGYTKMIENMIDGADVELGVNFFDKKEYWESKAKGVLFTGRIDEFFENAYGPLDYRGLRFENKLLEIPDFQGNAIVNYTEESVDYTRIIEHKHFTFLKSDHTLITREYPENWDSTKIPYYPINTQANNDIYNKYKQLSKQYAGKYHFGGRLAEYKYYDMHQVIASALTDVEKLF